MLYIPFFIGGIQIFNAVNFADILKIPEPVLFIPTIIAYNNHGNIARKIGNPVVIGISNKSLVVKAIPL